jgi:glycogen debranching enzyme
MPDSLLAVDGTSFLLSNRSGDLTGGTHGLFVRDARYLSRWRLLIDGMPPTLLTSHHVEPYSGLIFMMNAEGGSLPPNSISVIRRRVVGGGMQEQVELQNHLDEVVRFEVRLEVAADFLDLFEVKARHFLNPGDQVFTEQPAAVDPDANAVAPGGDGTVVFQQQRGAYFATVVIDADPGPVVDVRGMAWSVEVPPRAKWTVDLAVRIRVNGDSIPVRHQVADLGRDRRAVGASQRRGRGLPALQASWSALESTYTRAAADLASLLIDEPDLAAGLPAAGLPWFMTVFGRDTLLTAYQILPAGQEMGWTAIETLAHGQAVADDPARDAEPGKILHELRRGPAAINGGHFPYFGTVDAPMLFVILLHELWRWSGDDTRARRFKPNALAALEWMRGRGDVDGDGFIEWHRRAPTGLANQAWKDSWDAFRSHDGSLATGPIAACEVQGYAYDACGRAAELAEGPWGDPGLAAALRSEASLMKARFNERFWTTSRGGYYHLALDGEKRPVDSMTSNMGHLLWSGIVTEERAPVVARQLLSRGLFSGWGIRTMASSDRGFNPISYHCGTVWPHDNSIAVAGLHRYGFHEEANRVMTALIEAAHGFHYRLPEVFAGYSRDAGPFPVEYPTASSPQAWACGSPILMLRAALGLEPDLASRSPRMAPHLPDGAGDLRLSGLSAFGRAFEVEIREGRAGLLEVEDSRRHASI